MDREKLKKLYAMGRKYLDERDYEKAKEKFREFLKHEDNVYVRNNLALALFRSGNLSEAILVLEPVLSGENESLEPNPYTFALTSIIYAASGDEIKARRYLKQAVEKFDRQLLLYSEDNIPSFFREYTLIIMKAAAALKDHQGVYRLYRRYKDIYSSWEVYHLAAVACFNMGDYRKAAKLWKKTEDEWPAASTMKEIAMLVHSGEVPPFELEYEPFSEKELDDIVEQVEKDERVCFKLFEKGTFKMIALAMLIVADEDVACGWLDLMISYGGEWGEELGKRILNSYSFPDAFKTTAAGALTKKGLFNYGEPVQAVIDGRKTQVEIRRQEIIPERDEKLDEILVKARELKYEGKLDEAIKLLEEIVLDDKFYLYAAKELALLYRITGEERKAWELEKILEKIMKDRIDFMLSYSASMIDEMIRSMEEDMRKDVEQKTIKVDVSLTKGIKNMPAEWVEGACKAYGLEPSRRRSQKEKQLCSYLSVKENLKKAVEQLGESEIQVLKYLLRKGGWSRLNAVTRKFGSMDGDGYYWAEKPPKSPLGVLWSRALVMVGRANLEGKKCKIVVIPLELRQLLREILNM